MINNANLNLFSLLNANKWLKSGVNTQAASSFNHAFISANANHSSLLDQVMSSNEAKRMAGLWVELKKHDGSIISETG